MGELEGDTILESEYILLLAFLGRQDSPLVHKAARYIEKKQLPEGGWAMYPGGKVEISGSVKAYFALKLTGHDPSSEYMQRARAAILAHGGADAVNSFTRFYLALLGQISYEQCPAVPPEVVLAAHVVPDQSLRGQRLVADDHRAAVDRLGLSPGTPIAADRGIRELFLTAPETWDCPAARASKAERAC